MLSVCLSVSLSVYLCVCLDVNQGAMTCNRCTQNLVILRAQIYKLLMNSYRTPKLGRPQKEVGVT